MYEPGDSVTELPTSEVLAGAGLFAPQRNKGDGGTNCLPGNGITSGAAVGSTILSEWRPSAATLVSEIICTSGSTPPKEAGAHCAQEFGRVHRVK